MRVDPIVGLDIDGRYSVLRKIGAGGMGDVYLARQKSGGTKLAIERDVAIKFLRANSAGEQELLKRFRSEADIVSKLKHPHTLTFFDSGETSTGEPYFVTEYLEGESLGDRLDKGPLGEKRALEIVRDVCSSLEEAHALGVVHRDLKPANIFLARVHHEEVVKVLDFGIAKIMERAVVEASHRTETGALVGTPAYASPEQARGVEITPRSDLYSLGVVLFECLTGKKPFDGNPMRVLMDHAQTPPPRPSGVSRPALEDLLMRLLAKEPEGRPSHARAVREEIESILRELEVNPPVRSSSRKWPIVVLVIAVAGAVSFLMRSSEEVKPSPEPIAAPPPVRPNTPEGMVHFEGGRFFMGSTLEEIETAFRWCTSLAGDECSKAVYEREQPRREVDVAAFDLETREVSAREFAEWLSREREFARTVAFDVATPIEKSGDGYRAKSGAEDHPMSHVAWKGADAFCRARGRRLPTEIEWTFAAGGKEGRRFPWGGAEPDCRRTAIGRGPKMGCEASGPSHVGSEPQDVTPEGVHDLGGNVAEWTADPFQPRYDGSMGVDLEKRSVRGGWWNMWQESARTRGRSRWGEDEPASNIGFRCARGATE